MWSLLFSTIEQNCSNFNNITYTILKSKLNKKTRMLFSGWRRMDSGRRCWWWRSIVRRNHGGFTTGSCLTKEVTSKGCDEDDQNQWQWYHNHITHWFKFFFNQNTLISCQNYCAQTFDSEFEHYGFEFEILLQFHLICWICTYLLIFNIYIRSSQNNWAWMNL